MARTFDIRLLGDPCLTTVCKPVASLDEIPEDLVSNMMSVLHESRFGQRPGVGLAANQVGADVRVILVKDGPRTRVMINPEIVAFSPEMSFRPEGCLSVPGFTASKVRRYSVTACWRDESFVMQSALFAGFDAQIVQHEIDHLDGKLVTDGVSRQQRKQALALVAKVRAQHPEIP